MPGVGGWCGGGRRWAHAFCASACPLSAAAPGARLDVKQPVCVQQGSARRGGACMMCTVRVAMYAAAALAARADVALLPVPHASAGCALLLAAHWR